MRSVLVYSFFDVDGEFSHALIGEILGACRSLTVVRREAESVEPTFLDNGGVFGANMES